MLVPVVLKAKLILQDMCKKGLGWDDVVPAHIALEWTKWIQELHLLKRFKLSRCFKPGSLGLCYLLSYIILQMQVKLDMGQLLTCAQ